MMVTDRAVARRVADQYRGWKPLPQGLWCLQRFASAYHTDTESLDFQYVVTQVH